LSQVAKTVSLLCVACNSMCQGNSAYLGSSAVCGNPIEKGVGKGHAETCLDTAQNASLKVLCSGDKCEARDLETGSITKGQEIVGINDSSKGIISPVHEAINGEDLSSDGHKGINGTLNSNCNKYTRNFQVE